MRLNEKGGWAGSMHAFRATGTFPNGRIVQKFTQDVVASDETDARHRVYSFFGSRHGVNRRFVKIENVAQIEPTESTAPAVISAFRDTHDFTAAAAAEEE
ncbi:MAG: 50S ribosomal protein L18Ae [Candidatus Poseidoniales archaeon]|nr:50S ribosomal protein L18Ae [Candidatus Poseidoniales archaeon]